MKKLTKVKLVSEGGEREFNHSHAQNLLDYEASKGYNNWSLPEKSPYELKDGIIQLRSNKSDQNTQASSKASKGN